jgi:hypothetical protein
VSTPRPADEILRSSVSGPRRKKGKSVTTLEETPMPILATQKPIPVALTMAASIASLIVSVMMGHTLAQSREKTSPLVVRVAVFSADQGRLDAYQGFIDGHLFPTLRTVPGYVGTFLGRDASSGQLILLSFWRSRCCGR